MNKYILIFVISVIIIVLYILYKLYKYRKESFSVQSLYQPSNLLLFSNLANLAYGASTPLTDYLNKNNISFDPSNTFTLVNSDTSFSWASSTDGKDLYFTFRGTIDWSNIVVDIEMEMIKFPVNYHNGFEGKNLLVHKGFINNYLKMADFMNSIIDQSIIKKNNIENVYFIGHSLGGALATLAAFDVFHNNENNVYTKYVDVKLLTFASPRVGNESFADYFDEIIPNSIRVVNKYDIIPRTPIYSLPFSKEGGIISKHNRRYDSEFTKYKHIDTMVLIGEPNKCEIGAQTLDNIPINPEEHKLTTYISYIQNLINEKIECERI
jgi:hypothetical protein